MSTHGKMLLAVIMVVSMRAHEVSFWVLPTDSTRQSLRIWIVNVYSTGFSIALHHIFKPGRQAPSFEASVSMM